MAYSDTSKFDRIIAFTNKEILDNYAVKFSIHRDSIFILDKKMSVLVIDSYEVAIRPCEFDNFSKILGDKNKHNINSNEYKNLMKFISKNMMPLSEFIKCDVDYYNLIKYQVTTNSTNTKIFDLLDKCREIILYDEPGSNVLNYLLHKMNNRIIKLQTNEDPCDKLSGLYLKYGCIPFEELPYSSSLVQHNPRIIDLIQSVSIEGKEHEMLANYIKNNTEINRKLFTPIDELEEFNDDIDDLINNYNSSLYYKHKRNRSIKRYKNYVFINGYVEDTINIIKKLKDLSVGGVRQYTASVDDWIKRENYQIDDSYKKNAMRNMFSESKVAFIYGAAGTGKSTLIKHISHFWANNTKLYLANTHSAVENLRNKVNVENCKFRTVASFLSESNQDKDFDILFIDECSTVSNSDMKNILEKAKFKLLVLVGDIYQIESIYFGNWFSISNMFVPKKSIHNLIHPFRTKNSELISLWNKVRNSEESILETMVANNIVNKLDNSIFKFDNSDEIILCLNYDGLYGINNINRFMQTSNPHKEFSWGINIYKIGDPILFNESNPFAPLIPNNTKGKILDIKKDHKNITFEVELGKSINEIESDGYNFNLIGESTDSKNSVISFSINKYRSTDEDDYYDSTVVPFHIAYAVSIHKAQGLEYDSVKVVITNEVEEKITHNIFYTAITRSRKFLKIYWSPEVGQEVIKGFKEKEINRDSYLLSNYSDIEMNK